MNKTPTINSIVLAAVCSISHMAGAQQEENEQSSRREVAAIKAIEAAGGKVYRISAADDSREISCYLASGPIKDEHLKHASAIQNVIWMNLAGTEITDEGLRFIAEMPLEKLHLERTSIGDNGLQHLKKLKKLTYLNVYGSKVTDAGLDHLKGLKSLRKLYVWKTGVTESGMDKLKESLPELEIVGEVKLEPVVMEDPGKKKSEDEKEKEPADKQEKKEEVAKDSQDKSSEEKPKPDKKEGDSGQKGKDDK